MCTGDFKRDGRGSGHVLWASLADAEVIFQPLSRYRNRAGKRVCVWTRYFHIVAFASVERSVVFAVFLIAKHVFDSLFPLKGSPTDRRRAAWFSIKTTFIETTSPVDLQSKRSVAFFFLPYGGYEE